MKSDLEAPIILNGTIHFPIDSYPFNLVKMHMCLNLKAETELWQLSSLFDMFQMILDTTNYQ